MTVKRRSIEVTGPQRPVSVRVSAEAHELVHKTCKAADQSFNSTFVDAVDAAAQFEDGLPPWGGADKFLSARMKPELRAAVQRAADACGLHAGVWLKLIATVHLTPLRDQLAMASQFMPDPDG